jgi:transaldolase/glucose-6-phosphate isomerase
MSSPQIAVQQYGQSLWFDYISRDLLLSGELRRLVEEDGILGVTSNPAIFEKAIAGTHDYDPALAAATAHGADDAKSAFETVAIQDVQLACDVLRPVYDRTKGGDGFVSFEVSPHLAFDTQETVAEARRLYAAVGRPNVMIKVPATREGMPAIEELIGDGINVNVTLLFALSAYEAVHEAYISGLEKFVAAGNDPRRVASVASFFVSRIDASVGKQIDARLADDPTGDEKAVLEGLIGKVAIANAVKAYASYRATTATPRWKALADAGALPQRVLWASTGTKSPDLSATLYVDQLIGPDTVNTVPAATFEAFKSGGKVTNALGENLDARLAEAQATLAKLDEVGISLDAVTDELLTQGCQLFVDAFDQLLEAVEKKRLQVMHESESGA